MSNVVEKIKEKVDNVLHKNDNTGYDSNAYSTGSTGQTHPHHHNHNHHHHHNQEFGNNTHATSGFNGPAPTTEGPHRSDAANVVDPRVDSDADGRTNAGMANYGAGGARMNGPASTTAGPHTSNAANKLDPRVDSDADGSRNFGAAEYGPGSQQTGNTGAFRGQQSGNTGGAFTGATNTNNGPHNSNLANKLDPRVDSDADGSRNFGAAEYGPGSQQAGNTGAFRGQQSGNTGAFGGQQSGNTGGAFSGATNTNNGPHNSNLANKLDPRVDSDADGSQNMGMAQYGPGGARATGPASNTAGPHTSNLANKVDPRVDSDADGSRNFGMAQHGPGGAYNNNTAASGGGIGNRY